MIKDLLKRASFRVHKLGIRFGVYVLPVHYYASVANVLQLEMERERWAKKSALPGVSFDLDSQAACLIATCLPYQEEYAGNPLYREAVHEGFGPGYGYIEAQCLHGFLRHTRPQRVVEVGSGVSTYCTVKALRRNQEQTGESFSVTCVEPYPSDALKALDGITVLPQSVQSVTARVFDQLGRGDFLFVDSTHTVVPGGDVPHIILEVLPRLRPGVLVHFHDIWLPYDYACNTLITYFQWMESAMVHAYLVDNARVEILFCLSYLHHERPEAIAEVFPEYDPESLIDGLLASGRPLGYPTRHFPTSLYLRVT